MPQLPDLPLELLLQICSVLSIRDLQNLRLSHSALTSAASIYVFRNMGKHNIGLKPPQVQALLHIFSRNPSLGAYVKTARVYLDHPMYTKPFKSEARRSIVTKEVQRLGIPSGNFLNYSVTRPESSDAQRPTIYGTYFPLLLARMENLESLQVMIDDRTRLWSGVKFPTMDHHPEMWLDIPSALQSLRTLWWKTRVGIALDSFELSASDDCTVPGDCVIPMIAAAPNLTAVGLSGCTGWGADTSVFADTGREDTRNLNIHTLELEHCLIDGLCLAQFISRLMPRLKDLTYSYRYSIPTPFNSAHFDTALEVVKDTLESLDIVVCVENHATGPQGGLDMITHCRRLKKLSVPAALLPPVLPPALVKLSLTITKPDEMWDGQLPQMLSRYVESENTGLIMLYILDMRDSGTVADYSGLERISKERGLKFKLEMY